MFFNINNSNNTVFKQRVTSQQKACCLLCLVGAPLVVYCAGMVKSSKQQVVQLLEHLMKKLGLQTTFKTTFQKTFKTTLNSP